MTVIAGHFYSMRPQIKDEIVMIAVNECIRIHRLNGPKNKETLP
jgi:hypothetical protein